MADKKKTSRQLSILVPNAMRVMVDGGEVFVASTKDENSTLNMVVAAQLRTLLQESIKSYKERGATLTPKEIKELTEAASNISKFSTEIYAGADPLSDPTEKEKNVTSSGDLGTINFDNLVKKPNGNQDVQPDQPPTDE